MSEKTWHNSGLLLIKVEIPNGEFVEGRNYDMIFDPEKMSVIRTAQNRNTSIESLLERLCGKTLPMKYRGVSRVDNKKIFTVDPVSSLRQIQLVKILDEDGVQ